MTHLVLIGLNFQNKKSTGDKNFWYDLISELALYLKRITIFSIRDNLTANDKYTISDCEINIHYLNPKLLNSPDSTNKKLWNNGVFPSVLGIVEKALNFRRLLAALNDLKLKEPFEHIHLMDNFGFVNNFLAGNISTPLTVSAMSYQGRKPSAIYDFYLRLSYGWNKRVKTVAYNDTLKNKLIGLGINSEKIHVIPWGINTGEFLRLPETEKENLKHVFGISAKNILVLWSGYIQQIGRNDFMLAYKSAKKVLEKKESGISFLFAFKPESYEEAFLKDFKQDGNLIIRKTTKEEFDSLTKCTDIFFSPFTNMRCIIAPPLTWIEVLGKGIPIVTTPVPGAENIIIPGETGEMSFGENNLAESILSIVAKSREKIKKRCITLVNTKFGLQTCGKNYIDLFNRLASGERNAV